MCACKLSSLPFLFVCMLSCTTVLYKTLHYFERRVLSTANCTRVHTMNINMRTGVRTRSRWSVHKRHGTLQDEVWTETHGSVQRWSMVEDIVYQQYSLQLSNHKIAMNLNPLSVALLLSLMPLETWRKPNILGTAKATICRNWLILIIILSWKLL